MRSGPPNQVNGMERATNGRRLEDSGEHWVGRFRGSRSPTDLRGSFRGNAEAFVGALRGANAAVGISSTYRPPKRAYLMHWAWLIVRRNVDPAAVPAMDGVDINWVHKDAEGQYSRQLSVAAAQAMVRAFDIGRLGVAPALQSRHTVGLGIDMSISWIGALLIPDAYGNSIEIRTFTRSGMNVQLHRVGESYGVIKYNRAGRDEPHWSDNGS